MAEADDDAAAACAARFARVIMTAADALRSGDAAYALRLLEVFERRIKRGVAREQARQDAGATRH